MNLEIRGCVEKEDEIVSLVEKPDFFTVYEQQEDNTWQAITDEKTLEDAVKYAYRYLACSIKNGMKNSLRYLTDKEVTYYIL
jgi:hypothetical protein